MGNSVKHGTGDASVGTIVGGSSVEGTIVGTSSAGEVGDGSWHSVGEVAISTSHCKNRIWSIYGQWLLRRVAQPLSKLNLD